MDRFFYTDKPPIIVGRCIVCHEDIQQGYEKACEICGDMLCEDCLHECWVCQRKGGVWCINKKDTNKECICDECLDSRRRLMGSMYIEGYYHSGTSETDEETILEYTSLNDGPGIEVRIKKVRD